jgi:RimJ/RimL family protein N-acetyltransferase
MNDAVLLWEWVNDEVVRANSFSATPIAFPDHVDWLRQRLGGNRCLIYVLEKNGVPIGQARYDKVQDTAEIDISIAAGYRGHGYGQRALTLTRIDAIKRLGVVSVTGTVLASNIPSIATFLKTDFEESHAADVDGSACRVFVWQRGTP